MKILISPHSDDAVLFASYTILREKPLVITVTHSTLQGNNGNERVLEDYEAMRILGVSVCFLGIDENKLTKDILYEKLEMFKDSQDDELVFIPSYEDNGNPHHNLINEVAKELWGDIDYGRVKEYKTYTGLEDRSIGKEIVPTEEELELKKKAMLCYQSQIRNPLTNHYFSTTKEYQ